MARKFVSPGVFTQEIDRSYLAQGVANIGAAVIGLSAKGPAFAPVTVADFNEFAAQLGDVDPAYQMPYAAKNYLKNSSVLNVVRVLGSRDGNEALTNGWNHSVVAITDASGTTLAQVHVLSGTTFSLSGSTASPSFSFSGATGQFTGTYNGTLSFNPSNANHINKVLNTDSTKAAQYGHYLFKSFQWAHSASAANTPFATASLSGAHTTASYDYDFATPATPWVLSQYGDQLFYFESIADGAKSDIKVTIANIKASPYPQVTKYGTFDVVVRLASDTDRRQQPLETFSNVTLDPASPNYLPRVIGDQYAQWNSTTRKNVVMGTYKNHSDFVIVHMNDSANWDASALPWGHKGYGDNVATGGALADIPLVQDNLDSAGNVAPSYWGVDLTQDGVADRLKAWARGTGNSAARAYLAAGADLLLTHVSQTLSGTTTYKVYNTGSTAYVPSTTAEEGFTMALAGGFDGWDLTQADPAPTGTWALDYLKTSFKLAVDAISNPDEIDLNLLAIPGVTDATVAAYASLMCNTRADCMYIMDIDASSVSAAVSAVNNGGYDDNYAATYYPDLRYSDTVNGVLVRVKPSVAVLGAYAFSDRVGQVFFAPAGLNRGGLAAFGIVDTVDRLTFQDRNDLYEARINPIATFPSEGIVVFGQKTLQAKPSALDRVNVRRLLIYAKKTVASAAKYLLFEPNNPNTWQRFINTVNPILEKIRQDQGIERFKVVMDSTVNTPDLIDRNIMTGKIFLQPTRSAEYIDLSFIITASGVSFEE